MDISLRSAWCWVASTPFVVISFEPLWDRDYVARDGRPCSYPLSDSRLFSPCHHYFKTGCFTNSTQVIFLLGVAEKGIRTQRAVIARVGKGWWKKVREGVNLLFSPLFACRKGRSDLFLIGAILMPRRALQFSLTCKCWILSTVCLIVDFNWRATAWRFVAVFLIVIVIILLCVQRISDFM